MAFGGEGERFLLVIERWRTKSLWQQEREDVELFFVVMVEQGFFVWFNHFARFCFPVFGQAGLDFVLGRIVGVDSLMVFWCVERNPSYLSFGISISTPTVLEFLQILFSLLWRTGLDIYHCFSEGSTYQVNNVSIYIFIYVTMYIYIYMGIYTYKYAVFFPKFWKQLERPWQLSSFFNDSFAPRYPLQISRDWESIFAGFSSDSGGISRTPIKTW